MALPWVPAATQPAWADSRESSVHGRAGLDIADERGGSSGVVLPPAQGGTAASVAAERVQAAFHRGLDFLVAEQARTVDGSLPSGRAQRSAPVGVTALTALALLSSGSTPGRGPYGEAIDKALTYLLGKADSQPDSPTFGYIQATGDVSQTHGHGLATLALTQAFGMTPRNTTLKRAVVQAVHRIQTSQGTEGGWHYSPNVSAQHEGSVTIAYVQALRAARNVGIRVDTEVIRRAEDYVLRLQNESGLFRYGLNENRASVGLTAAAIGTLNAAGRYDTNAIQNGIDAIWKKLSADGSDPRSYPYYERFYLAQAFWQLSDTRNFERWFEGERDRILREQGPDGSWRDAQHGDAYATAMNCLVLAIPDGLLPIFQR